MTEYTDTHAHLDGIRGGSDAIDAALRRAANAGVSRVIAVGGNPEGNRLARDSVRRHPVQVRAAIGFDRYGAARTDLDFTELETQLAAPGVVALGEIGLDFHYAPDTAAAQETLLNRMLDLAAARCLPVIVHCRDAEGVLAPILEAHAARWTGEPDRIGVIHCFAAGEGFARRMLACGFHLSFSGILTFPKGDNVRAVAAWAPENRLLVETDTPFLAPVPHRGTPNEPALVTHVVEGLARLRGVPPERMAALTTANARRLFALE